MAQQRTELKATFVVSGRYPLTQSAVKPLQEQASFWGLDSQLSLLFNCVALIASTQPQQLSRRFLHQTKTSKVQLLRQWLSTICGRNLSVRAPSSKSYWWKRCSGRHKGMSSSRKATTVQMQGTAVAIVAACMWYLQNRKWHLQTRLTHFTTFSLQLTCMRSYIIF